MLSLLIFTIILNRRKQKTGVLTGLTKTVFNRSALFSLVQVTAIMLLASTTFAQKEILSYKVVQNRKNIGWIRLQKDETGAISRIKLDSEIRKRVVFLVSITEKQEVSFSKGVMTESYLFRKINEEIKMNKHTTFTGNFYEARDRSSSQQVMIPRIHFNQLSLYFKEPLNIKEVYFDSYQRFLNIEPNGNSSYKITLPGGDSNYYFYENGICSRIRLEHSLFTVEFILV